MKLCVVAVLAHVLVTLVCGASIGRYESEKPAQTTVIHLLRTSDAQDDRRPADEKKQEDQRPEEEEYYYDDDDYDLSGDFEMPQVAFSSKPKDPTTVLNAERREDEAIQRREKGEKKGKGKGKKRNPCLKKYKDYCIHGTCQYLRKIGPSCICNQGYSGVRCHFFSLPVSTHEGGYSRTTALAVVAVVLSSLCLTIIGLLLALRFHKRGAYEVENEEKVKLGTSTHR